MKNKKIILIVILTVVLTSILVGGVVWLMLNQQSETTNIQNQTEVVAADPTLSTQSEVNQFLTDGLSSFEDEDWNYDEFLDKYSSYNLTEDEDRFMSLVLQICIAKEEFFNEANPKAQREAIYIVMGDLIEELAELAEKLGSE